MKYFELRACNHEGRVMAKMRMDKITHAPYYAGVLWEQYGYRIADFELWHCDNGCGILCAVGKEGYDEGRYHFHDTGARVC